MIEALEIASGKKAKFIGKPEPLLYQMALERLGTLPYETLAVGDRDLDIQSGYRVGVHTCLFGPTATEVEPDLRVTSYEELLDYLQELND